MELSEDIDRGVDAIYAAVGTMPRPLNTEMLESLLLI